MQKPAYTKNVIKFRKLKKININEIKKDIRITADKGRTINDLVALVDYYNEELCIILDKHAHQEHCLVALRKPTQWTPEDIKFEKQKKTTWTKMEKNMIANWWRCIQESEEQMTALLKAFSIAHNSDLVKTNADNPKALFRIINSMLHRKGETPMPSNASEHVLANKFSNFFKQKIQTIWDYLDKPKGNNVALHIWQDQPKFSTQLSEFKSLTEAEVKKIVLNSPNKYTN